MAQVLDQTVRRVPYGEMVPARDKLVSLFEPHTQIIVRRKTGNPMEFGRKVWLEEVQGGTISGYRMTVQNAGGLHIHGCRTNPFRTTH